MPDVVVSPLRFVIEHRNPAPGGGPTLRVYREGEDRELLRFDGFLDQGHWHVDPSGADELSAFEGEDAIDGTLRLLRGDLPGPVVCVVSGGNINAAALSEVLAGRTPG